jgi:hypothetical protein
MQAAKAKSIALKGAIVVAALFIITGPANHAIANKLSSPTSAVNGFFDALTANDAAAALSNVNITDFEASKGLLTDEVLKNYLHKPKVTSVEITQSDADYASATVEYSLNGELLTADLSLAKDSEHKLYKIFPVWKISQAVLKRVDIAAIDGKKIKFSNVDLPTDSSIGYVFPGIALKTYVDPIKSKVDELRIPAEPYQDITYKDGQLISMPGAEAYIEKIARANIIECNGMSENLVNECPLPQDVNTRKLDTVEHFTVTEISWTYSGYSFRLTFDGTMSVSDPSTGSSKSIPYTYDSTCYLRALDGYGAIYWW